MFFKRTNIAKFKKVSYKEYRNAFYKLYLNQDGSPKEDAIVLPDYILYLRSNKIAKKEDIEAFIKRSYDDIIIPERKTYGSAGHDISVPFDFKLQSIFGNNINMASIMIPTGLRCYINTGWVLDIRPRSGWGSKGIKLENTTPIIDEDYYFADNEGHIYIKVANENKERQTFEFKTGERVAQGLFYIYGTAGKSANVKRTGGLGSTSSKK